MLKDFEKNFDAVIFDMDGTLLNSMPYWRKINYDFLKARGLEPSEDVRADLMSISTRVAGKMYIDQFHLNMTLDQVMAEYRRLMAHYYMEEIQPKPNIKKYIRHLKNMGKRVCVGTATPRALAEPALARHGLLEEFEFVMSGIDEGLLKEKPAFYLEAARRLNLPPQRCAMFEDALYAMQGAREAGLWVMGIAEPVQKAHKDEIKRVCHLYVEDFSELCV